MSSQSLAQLPGLGPKSASMLAQVGITNLQQLRKVGAVGSYDRLCQHGLDPSLNFLYALEGALQGQDWRAVAANEKGRLLMELEGYRSLQNLGRDDIHPEELP